jgi:hypothetical protein
MKKLFLFLAIIFLAGCAPALKKEDDFAKKLSEVDYALDKSPAFNDRAYSSKYIATDPIFYIHHFNYKTEDFYKAEDFNDLSDTKASAKIVAKIFVEKVMPKVAPKIIEDVYYYLDKGYRYGARSIEFTFKNFEDAKAIHLEIAKKYHADRVLLHIIINDGKDGGLVTMGSFLYKN